MEIFTFDKSTLLQNHHNIMNGIAISAHKQPCSPLLHFYFMELHMLLFVACHRSPSYTVEPLNKGHFGSRGFVLFLEVVLWWEVQANRSFIDVIYMF